MKKILILQLNRMGDIIFTLPLIYRFKQEYPDCRITLLCYREFSEIIGNSSLIDRFIHIGIGDIDNLAGFMDDGTAGKNGFPELEESYDIAVNLAYDFGPAKISYILKADTKYGRISSRQDEIRLLGDWMKYLFSIIHNRIYNLFNMHDLFTRTGGFQNKKTGGFLEIDQPEQRRKKVASLLAENGSAFDSNNGLRVAFQMGASEPIRAWEIEKFAELGTILSRNDGLEVVLIGSPNEAGLGETFLSMVDYPVVNLIGQTGIPDLPVLLESCDLLVSNDTGPVHIAAAMGTRVLGIYFASAYFAETAPYGEGHVVIQAELPCSPCTDFAQCKHFDCRKTLTVEAVADAAEMMLFDNSTANTGEKTVFNYPGVSFYRSQFLENGSLIYAPIKTEAPSERYRMGLLNRILWEPEEDLDFYLKFIDDSVPGLKDTADFTEAIDRYRQELGKLGTLFQHGVVMCETLEKEFLNPRFNQKAITDAVNRLSGIETLIDKRDEPLSVLKHFFSFEMMDMGFLQFPPLATELKKKYKKLTDFAESGMRKLDRLTAHTASQ
jgi:ADP-heptose:LPS heptosyltransferase